tara:strand:+ start:63 stop:284 length:222 start_codon:yes stop_codon:yes gene_type:complete
VSKYNNTGLLLGARDSQQQQLSLDLGDTQASMVNHINCKVASLQKQKEDIIVSMANDCVRHYNRIFGNPAVGS